MAEQSLARAKYRLALLLGEDAVGHEFLLEDSVVSIGRQSGNDVCLFWDPRTSRHHARLKRGPDGWLLEDLHSTNGTYLGEQRVGGLTLLKPGDKIRMGRTWLELRVEEDVPKTEPDQVKPAAKEAAAEADVIGPPGQDALASFPADRSLPVLEATTSQPPRDTRPENEEPGEPEYVQLADTHARETPSPSSNSISCTIFPLAVDIRAPAPASEGAPDVAEIRATLEGLQSTEHVALNIVQTLGGRDAWISVCASPGHQAALLIFAGQVIDRLVHAGPYHHVLLAPAAQGTARQVASHCSELSSDSTRTANLDGRQAR